MGRCKVQALKEGKRVRNSSHIPYPPIIKFSTAQIHQKASHVCAIYEDGGHIAICDGPCLRQFHLNPTSEGALERNYPGVNLPSDHQGNWKCHDCMAHKAVCTGCGKLGNFQGSADAPPEVRKCTDKFCVKFYCFTCLPADVPLCALHKCKYCGKPDGEFWVDIVHYLRCPLASHYETVSPEGEERWLLSIESHMGPYYSW